MRIAKGTHCEIGICKESPFLHQKLTYEIKHFHTEEINVWNESYRENAETYLGDVRVPKMDSIRSRWRKVSSYLISGSMHMGPKLRLFLKWNEMVHEQKSR